MAPSDFEIEQALNHLLMTMFNDPSRGTRITELNVDVKETR